MKNGKPSAVAYQSYNKGFLCLGYDDDGLVSVIGFTPKSGGEAFPMRLFFDWNNGHVTFKSEGGLSGQTWSLGTVSSGTVYDDPPPEVEETQKDLNTWIMECMEEAAADGNSA